MCKSTECQKCKNNNGVWVIPNELLNKEKLEKILVNALPKIKIEVQKVENSTVEVNKDSIKGKVEKMEMNLNKDKEVKRLAEIILREMTDKKLPRVILEEALDIVDDKFLHDATI